MGRGGGGEGFSRLGRAGMAGAAAAAGALARVLARGARGGASGACARRGFAAAGVGGGRGAPKGAVAAAASFVASGKAARGFAAAGGPPVAEGVSPLEAKHAHVTGLQAMEAQHELEHGQDPYTEAWVTAERGTAASPVVVTSAASERIVGVTDTHDDSIVVWDTIRAGDPPRQIVEDGEYFVLKQVS